MSYMLQNLNVDREDKELNRNAYNPSRRNNVGRVSAPLKS